MYAFTSNYVVVLEVFQRNIICFVFLSQTINLRSVEQISVLKNTRKNK